MTSVKQKSCAVFSVYKAVTSTGAIYLLSVSSGPFNSDVDHDWASLF